MRSTRTKAEFKVAAMMLTMRYNPNYHIFQNSNGSINLDADTLEHVHYEQYADRRMAVWHKTLGACDYDLEAEELKP